MRVFPLRVTNEGCEVRQVEDTRDQRISRRMRSARRLAGTVLHASPADPGGKDVLATGPCQILKTCGRTVKHYDSPEALARSPHRPEAVSVPSSAVLQRGAPFDKLNFCGLRHLSLHKRGAGRLQDDVVARWADLLVDYCLKVERGRDDRAVSSESLAQPLVEACYKAIVLRGGASAGAAGAPRAARVLPRARDRGPTGALCPPRRSSRPSRSTARIRIAAESDTRSMSRVDPRRQAIFERARDPIRQAARRARWVLTQYPTAAYAADARMTLAEYEDVRHPRDVPRSARPARRPGKSWGVGRRAWSNSCRASGRSGSRPTAPT